MAKGIFLLLLPLLLALNYWFASRATPSDITLPRIGGSEEREQGAKGLPRPRSVAPKSRPADLRF